MPEARPACGELGIGFVPFSLRHTTAARIGVHGNRYNDLHMSLVER